MTLTPLQILITNQTALSATMDRKLKELLRFRCGIVGEYPNWENPGLWTLD